jgi:hypothetical protein
MCGSNLLNFDPKLPMRCRICCQVIFDWNSASSWSDLLDYNREFIEGARTATPYSIYPLFKDEAIHEGILRLHDYGIMVVDAQPDYHKIGIDEGGRWFEIKERAYLRCVMPTNLASIPTAKIEFMLDLLIEAPHLETVMYHEYADYLAGEWIEGDPGYRCAPPTTAHKVDVSKIPRSQFFRSSIGPSLTGRTVAKHRIADSKEGLVWKRWKRCKHNQLPVMTEGDLPRGSQGLRAFGSETKLTLDMRPVVFTVSMRDWASAGLSARLGLAGVLEFACQEAGLEPLFEEVVDKEEEEEGAGEEAELPAMLDKLSVD